LISGKLIQTIFFKSKHIPLVWILRFYSNVYEIR